METYEGNVEDFMPSNQSAQDESLLVKFLVRPRPDKTRTVSNGRPVFVDTEYIDIRVPGSRDNVCRPATEADKARFPRHYAAFKQRVEAPLEGTPLVEWPLVTRSMAEELAFLNVKTVEQLANVADSHAGKFLGLLNLKRQAQEWLEDAKDDAPVVKLTQKLEETEAQLQARDVTIADLTQRLAALEQKLAPSAPSPSASLESSLDEGEQSPPDSASEVDAAAPPAAPSPARAARRRRRNRVE